MLVMRKYLVVLYDSDEARVALRFAARRASKTVGTVEIVVLVPDADGEASIAALNVPLRQK